ncbi:hypothetical protein M1307_01600 [Patescibacteria group bacterium]|nr:hypothetical protein [Patescibacteria group bacterium]MCL5970445.1 hypothetical protein [Patescibacteria group bacterium]
MVERLTYSKVDTHGGHSNRRDGTRSPQELCELAQQAGLAFFVITDHDIWEQFRSDSDFPVLFGVELTTGEGHIVGLYREGSPREKVRMGLSAEDSMKAIHDGGGKAILAHPEYWFFFISATFNTIRRLNDKGVKIDGIEVMHPALSYRKMLKTMKLATELGIPQLGVSDNHYQNNGRECVTFFPRTTDDPINDFFAALGENQVIPARSDLAKFSVTWGERISRHTKGPSSGFKEKWENKGVFAGTWKNFARQTSQYYLNYLNPRRLIYARR